ncbi:hypothetical protein R1sor_006649 [Riccia sorocarpa]|uniref:Uncharacterized protein n=1 Tax=Riccia sorocarpa TaxID=122646 RepID=A0ABD3HNM8_9MARC
MEKTLLFVNEPISGPDVHFDLVTTSDTIVMVSEEKQPITPKKKKKHSKQETKVTRDGDMYHHHMKLPTPVLRPYIATDFASTLRFMLGEEAKRKQNKPYLRKRPTIVQELEQLCATVERPKGDKGFKIMKSLFMINDQPTYVDAGNDKMAKEVENPTPGPTPGPSAKRNKKKGKKPVLDDDCPRLFDFDDVREIAKEAEVASVNSMKTSWIREHIQRENIGEMFTSVISPQKEYILPPHIATYADNLVADETIMKTKLHSRLYMRPHISNISWGAKRHRSSVSSRTASEEDLSVKCPFIDDEAKEDSDMESTRSSGLDASLSSEGIDL